MAPAGKRSRKPVRKTSSSESPPMILQQYLPISASLSQKGLHPCPECYKPFTRWNDVQRHIKCVHRGIRKYICDICGKDFGQRAHLKNHLNTHTKTKPHRCDYAGCDARYDDPSALSRHRRNVHGHRSPRRRNTTRRSSGSDPAMPVQEVIYPLGAQHFPGFLNQDITGGPPAADQFPVALNEAAFYQQAQHPVYLNQGVIGGPPAPQFFVMEQGALVPAMDPPLLNQTYAWDLPSPEQYPQWQPAQAPALPNDFNPQLFPPSDNTLSAAEDLSTIDPASPAANTFPEGTIDPAVLQQAPAPVDDISNFASQSEAFPDPALSQQAPAPVEDIFSFALEEEEAVPDPAELDVEGIDWAAWGTETTSP